MDHCTLAFQCLTILSVCLLTRPAYGLPEVDREAEVRDQVDAALWPVFVLYEGFLDVVQLKYFYQLADELGFETFEDFSTKFIDNWSDYLLYWIGFLCCVAIGLLASVAMLCSCLCVPTCRCCCRKCGGKRSPRDGKHADRDRLGCSLTLAVVNGILIVGVAVMYVTSQKISQQLVGDQTFFDGIATGLTQLQPYLHQTVNDVNRSTYVPYVRAADDVFGELYKLPDAVLGRLNEETRVGQAVGALTDFSAELPTLNGTLTQINQNANGLQQDAVQLNASITTVKSDIVAKLENCTGSLCEEAKNDTGSLSVLVDYGSVNVSAAAVAVERALRDGFPQTVEAMRDELQKINETVQNTTRTSIEQAERESDRVEKDIEDFVLELNGTFQGAISGLNETAGSLDEVEDSLEENQIDVYLFWSMFGLSSLLSLIVLVSCIGISYCCCDRPPPRGSSCCTRADGAGWLLAGVGCTFIVYWMLMLIVMVMFLAGGLVYTEFCRSMVYFEDEHSQKVLATYDRLLTTNGSLGGPFDVYLSCADNESIYRALNLAENGHNLTEIVNLTVIEQLMESIKRQPVPHIKVNLTSNEIEKMLLQLENGTHLNYMEMQTELKSDITNVNLTSLAEKLQRINETYDIGLDAEIEALRKLSQKEAEMASLALSTSAYINDIQEPLSTNFSEISRTLSYAELYLNQNGSLLISSVINVTVDDVKQTLLDSAEHIIEDIEENVGKCRPLYDSITVLVDTFCVKALYPFNCYWFSLGWCLFFLIPHLILSFKLVKLFRKTQPYESQRHRKSLEVDNFAFEATDALEEYRKEVTNNLNKESSDSRPSSTASNSFVTQLTGALEAYRKEIANNPKHPNHALLPRPSLKRH